MSNTKFIKVETIDRLPEKNGEYICSLKRTHKKKILTFSTNDRLDTQYYKFNVDYFLQEVPDRESELIEMLEKSKNKLQMFKSEFGQGSELIDEIDSLIQSVKQPK